MINMESPQMYDTVQTLSQLDLKKQPQPNQAIIGQITLTAMTNSNGNLNNGNVNGCSDPNNNINNNGVHHNGNGNASGGSNPGLVVKQHAVHHMQQAAALNNNNSNTVNNNNNNNNNNNLNVNNVANNLLQKQMLQQYTQNDLDELTAQEITLDLQHLIDDQFREQEALGIFSDMVSSPGNLSSTLPTNGVVSAAAKVLQQHQLQQQQNALRTQNHGYGRSALAYMPQAVHSGATYSNNTNSSDDNSSVGSDTSTIKEEPIDPEYRRHLQETSSGNAAAFIGVAAAAANGTANGLYNPYQAVTNGSVPNGGTGNFTNLTPANVLHHSNLPHLTGAHLASLKHHNKQMQHVSQRKQSLKHVDKGTDEYRRRRERNNIAVRKSREKAKVRSREVEERVKTLLKEKDALLRRLEEMTNEIQLHKQVYMQLMNHTNPEVSRICRSFLNMSDHGI